MSRRRLSATKRAAVPIGKLARSICRSSAARCQRGPAGTNFESADVLFDFGKSSLKDAGKAKLDELADRLQGASLDEIKIVGHADRIGSPQHNKRLSEARAETVREYLRTRTSARTFEIAGKGSTQPVSNCKGLGADQGSNRRLVQCLQADRRVEIELFGVRSATQRPADPAVGGTQPTNYAR